MKAKTHCFCFHIRYHCFCLQDGSEKLYRNDEIEAFEKRDGSRLMWDDRDHRKNVEHVFIAVDPSGGGPSAFSIASALILENGFINVCFLLLLRSFPCSLAPLFPLLPGSLLFLLFRIQFERTAFPERH
jgi:hypothetical protein